MSGNTYDPILGACADAEIVVSTTPILHPVNLLQRLGDGQCQV
jgi:hypothetical protein